MELIFFPPTKFMTVSLHFPVVWINQPHTCRFMSQRKTSPFSYLLQQEKYFPILFFFAHVVLKQPLQILMEIFAAARQLMQDQGLQLVKTGLQECQNQTELEHTLTVKCLLFSFGSAVFCLALQQYAQLNHLLALSNNKAFKGTVHFFCMSWGWRGSLSYGYV